MSSNTEPVPKFTGAFLKPACDESNIETIEWLLKQGVDPSADDNYLIRDLPAKGDYPELIKILLADSRVSPDAKNNQALRTACVHGRIETVKLLLADLRVDPNAGTDPCIVSAAQSGHLAIVKLLLAHPKVDPTCNQCRPIRYAAVQNHKEVVLLLLTDPRITMKLIEDGCKHHCCPSELAYIKNLKKDVEPNELKEAVRVAIDAMNKLLLVIEKTN